MQNKHNKSLLPFSSPVNYAYINGQINKSNRKVRNERESTRPHSCLAERPRYSRSPSPVPTHQVSIKVRDDDSRIKEHVEHVYVNISDRNEMDNFLRFCDERIEKVMKVKPKFEVHISETGAN